MATISERGRSLELSIVATQKPQVTPTFQSAPSLPTKPLFYLVDLGSKKDERCISFVYPFS